MKTDNRPDLATRKGKAMSSGKASDMAPPKSNRMAGTGSGLDKPLGSATPSTVRPSLDVRIGKAGSMPGGPDQSGCGGEVGSGKPTDSGVNL